MSSPLKFIICPTNHLSSHDQPVCDRIYSFWYQTWLQTFGELGMKDPLKSDSFVTSDFATVIFHRNQIISMSLYRVFNTRTESFANLSYFAKWGDSLKYLLEYERIFNCTYFCVRPDFRNQTFDGLTMKQINLAMLLKAFVESEIPAMAATPRKDRNMHKLLYQWGGTCLKEDQPSGYGDLVDLVIYKKPDVMAALDKNPNALLDTLWDQRTVIPFDSTNFHLMVPAQGKLKKTG